MSPLRRALLGATVGLAAAAGGVATWQWFSGRSRRMPSDPAAEVMALRLPDLSGTVQPMSQWRGRILVVNFWATWCAPCREEIPIFVRTQARLGPQGLQFVGVAVDDPGKVAVFSREFAVNYPQLIGAIDTVEVSRRAGNTAGVLPFTVVINRQGGIAATSAGGIKEDALLTLLEPLLYPSRA